ncbi:MAG: alpha/beta hydrolase fold domain-containing protein, partial [Mycobacteriales bacterium]
SLATLAGLVGVAVRSLAAGAVLDRALCDGLREGSADLPAADLTGRWHPLLRPFSPRLAGVSKTADISYYGTGPRGRLDLYRPERPVQGAPVLLQVHGGGWVIGRKDQQGLPLMNHLASRGWICAAANYRLSPKAAFPDHLVDLKRALVWLREHVAEYGGDPDFIVVTGGSAGGHLAALLALTPGDPEYQPGFEDADTSVAACVPMYGVYDFADTIGRRDLARRRDRFLARVVMKRPFAGHEADYRKASPLCRVRSDAPPMFVVHGRHDSLVPVAEARAFVARLREVSRAPVCYAELPGTQHAFDVFASLSCGAAVRAVDRFLHAVRAGSSAVPAPGSGGCLREPTVT